MDKLFRGSNSNTYGRYEVYISTPLPWQRDNPEITGEIVIVPQYQWRTLKCKCISVNSQIDHQK